MATWSNPSDDGAEKEYRPLAEINVTPMVDVMLVLLVIFMITAPLLTVSVPIDLPAASAAPAAEPQTPLIVSLDRRGEAYIGDQPVAAADLKQRLGSLAARNPDRAVYVRGDRRIAYGALMDLLDLVNAAGFAKVSLVAEAAKPP